MTAIAHQPHPVTRALAGVRDELGGATEMPVWSMDAAETTATLAEIQATKAQLVELEARLLSHADRTEVAAPHRGHLDRELARPRHDHHPGRGAPVDAARPGLEDHDLTGPRCRAGSMSSRPRPSSAPSRPARRPTSRTPPARAGRLDAKALKHLGRHILEVACPEAADAHEAALLEREERDAAAATRLTMYEDGHGKVHGRFTLDTLTGAMLKKHLYALAAPKHRASQGPLGERRPTPERLGQAFVELIQRYPTKRLPKAGGLNATIVVLMHLDTLMGGFKSARLDTGETISPGAPAASRARPGSSPPSSTASPRSSTWAARSGSTARANGSPRPSKPAAARSKAATHHPARPTWAYPERWADGGQTNRDGIMICPPHHARAHDTRYQMTRQPNGKIAFHRRTGADLWQWIHAHLRPVTTGGYRGSSPSDNDCFNAHWSVAGLGKAPCSMTQFR